ncbi:MAG: adenosine deaminase [Dorea sp.]|nr:adenosine deaminase [Dorea sp.]
MIRVNQFCLDKEKDIIVTLYEESGKLFYVLRTPNHQTGNLISNLATVCNLKTCIGADGLKEIRGMVPCYYDGYNRRQYVFRMGGVKVATITPDWQVELKAYIPAIAKTLMSQTKEYHLDIEKTLVKTYILEDLKFHSDLHSHRSANLSPDLLIALGIQHQLNYPYYYVKKLGLKLTEEQRDSLEEQRLLVAERYKDCGLKGKYLDRRIDDHVEMNFADLILRSPENSAYNIPKIRASLTVMKDGQAVFTNLEKVYLYRYVFTKGVPAKKKIDLTGIELIPDADIVATLKQMEEDRQTDCYRNNTLYQDKLLWTARSYSQVGVTYAEISDTALVKKSEAAWTLRQIHEIMPAVTKETGVTLRFLAALRRIPLTIIRDAVTKSSYFTENLQVLKAVAGDPYVAGSDIVGEEINDICELRPIISAILEIAAGHPSFVVRIHAGENDSLPDNVLNSVRLVEQALAPGQQFPHMRIGHGLYTADLDSEKGKELLEILKKHHVVLEFQITSNVRLNNLSRLDHHPLKNYLNAGVWCVQGTDGGALYGTNTIDEQLSLGRMLSLSYDEVLKMRKVEDRIVAISMQAFEEKEKAFSETLLERNTEKFLQGGDETSIYTELETYYEEKIFGEADTFTNLPTGERRHSSAEMLKNQILPIPENKIPIVLAGGSFNNANRETSLMSGDLKLIDDLIRKADSKKVCFVIGPKLSGYEKYLWEQVRDKFQVFAFAPAEITEEECQKLKESGLPLRISIESSLLGTYKSFAYEIFKRRQSVILALDGNSAAANLIQDAKNSRYKSRTFIGAHSKILREKADSLQGYVTLLSDGDSADEILAYVNKFYEKLGKPSEQLLK